MQADHLRETIAHERTPVLKEGTRFGVHRNWKAVVIALHQRHSKTGCVVEHKKAVQLKNDSLLFGAWVEKALVVEFRNRKS